MSLPDSIIPSDLREKFEFHNFGHALEILPQACAEEWEDLLAMRTYFDCGLVDVGVIVTRSEELNDIFRAQGVMAKYGASTTWMGKLLYRLRSRRNGGCPILAIGIRKPCVKGETT